jgi:hypothetical protein
VCCAHATIPVLFVNVCPCSQQQLRHFQTATTSRRVQGGVSIAPKGENVTAEKHGDGLLLLCTRKERQEKSNITPERYEFSPAYVMDAVETSQQPRLHQGNVSFLRCNLKALLKRSSTPQTLGNFSVLGFKGFPQGSSVPVAHCIHVCSLSHEELNNIQMTRLDSRVQQRLRAHLPAKC